MRSKGPCLCCIKTCQNIFTSPVKRNKRKFDKQFWSSHGGTLVCLLAKDCYRTKWPPRVMLLGRVIFATLPNVFFVKIKESFYYNRLNVAGTNVFRSNVARSTDLVPIGLPIKFLLILMKFRQSIKRDCASIHLYLCISRHLKYFKYYLQGIVVF